ncbi:hypothetical protein BDF21DRAFT_450823, partial [Thamnidium elegans]
SSPWLHIRDYWSLEAYISLFLSPILTFSLYIFDDGARPSVKILRTKKKKVPVI